MLEAVYYPPASYQLASIIVMYKGVLRKAGFVVRLPGLMNALGLRKKIHPSWWRTECGPNQTSGDLRFKAWGGRDFFFLLWPFSVSHYLSLGLSSKVSLVPVHSLG